MPSAEAKKRRERFLLEEFLREAAIAATIVSERERPDFLIEFDNQAIGVELTELYVSHDGRQKSLQTQESLSDQIVQEGRKQYEASAHAYAYVRVLFQSHCDLRGLKRKEVAAQLACLVSELGPTEKEFRVWRAHEQKHQLNAVISSVRAYGVPSSEYAHWVITRAGWAASLTKDLIESRVKIKAARLSEYRTVTRVNWLVIVADGRRPSQLFREETEDLHPATISSPFERTFFYDYPRGCVIELGAKRA